MRVQVLLLLSSLSICSCGVMSETPEGTKYFKSSTDELVYMMAGSFSSAEQSLADPEYYNIIMHIYPIWESRKDAKWLYMETAVAAMEDKPYRQTVYRLKKKGAGTIECKVFTIPNQEKYIHAWKQPVPLSDISPEQLIEREGCDVLFNKNGEGEYVGKTAEGTCPTEMKGGAYVLSESTVGFKDIITWDRGMDEAGQQVWGAVKGGYHYKRM